MPVQLRLRIVLVTLTSQRSVFDLMCVVGL